MTCARVGYPSPLRARLALLALLQRGQRGLHVVGCACGRGEAMRRAC